MAEHQRQSKAAACITATNNTNIDTETKTSIDNDIQVTQQQQQQEQQSKEQSVTKYGQKSRGRSGRGKGKRVVLYDPPLPLIPVAKVHYTALPFGRIWFWWSRSKLCQIFSLIPSCRLCQILLSGVVSAASIASLPWFTQTDGHSSPCPSSKDNEDTLQKIDPEATNKPKCDIGYAPDHICTARISITYASRIQDTSYQLEATGSESDIPDRKIADLQIWVLDPSDAKFLWNHGCYGKGLLSRSEPTWSSRWKKAHQETDGMHNDDQGLSVEEITKRRRDNRLRQRASTKDATKSILSSESSKRAVVSGGDPNGSNALDDEQRLELSLEEAETMEPLQLSPWEALFLCNELKCLRLIAKDGNVISSQELWNLLSCYHYNHGGPDAFKDFLAKYCAYYYYRSKGWVVRSGIKFSSDFSIYKHGPKSFHSQFLVNVKKDDDASSDSRRFYGDAESECWRLLFSTNRVCAQVKKTLIVCNVRQPEKFDLQDTMVNPPDLTTFFVQEVTVGRYNPSRDRE